MHGLAEGYFAIALLSILGFVGTLAAYAIARLVTWGPSHPFKRARYEAGNPPTERPRVPTIPQYYGYIIIFIVLDPIFALLFLTPSSAAYYPFRTLLWVILVSAILVPPLLYALRYAEKIEYWVWEGPGLRALRKAAERREAARRELGGREAGGGQVGGS